MKQAETERESVVVHVMVTRELKLEGVGRAWRGVGMKFLLLRSGGRARVHGVYENVLCQLGHIDQKGTNMQGLD